MENKRNINTLVKKDIANILAKKYNIPMYKANLYVNSIFNAIVEALTSGSKIRIGNFVSLQVTKHKARLGRNPVTGERIMIEARPSIKYTTSTNLKAKLLMLAKSTKST